MCRRFNIMIMFHYRWLRGRRFDVKNEFERMEISQWNDKESLRTGENMSTNNK